MSNSPAYYAIDITKGDDFYFEAAWKVHNCDTGEETPVDISGATVEAKIVDKSDMSVELITFTGGLTGDGTDGSFYISLTDTQTATLSGASLVKPVETLGKYYIRLILSSGDKKTILRGNVNLTSVEGL